MILQWYFSGTSVVLPWYFRGTSVVCGESHLGNQGGQPLGLCLLREKLRAFDLRVRGSDGNPTLHIAGD